MQNPARGKARRTAGGTAAPGNPANARRRQTVLDRIAAGVKECRDCHASLPFAAFRPHAWEADGHASRCHACLRKWRAQKDPQALAREDARRFQRHLAAQADDCAREIEQAALAANAELIERAKYRPVTTSIPEACPGCSGVRDHDPACVFRARQLVSV